MVGEQVLSEAISLFAEKQWTDGMGLLRYHSERSVMPTHIPSDDLAGGWSLAHESLESGNVEVAAALFRYCIPHKTNISADDMKAMCMCGATEEVLKICWRSQTDFKIKFIGTAYALNSLGRLNEFVTRHYSNIVSSTSSHFSISALEVELFVQIACVSRGSISPLDMERSTIIAVPPVRAWLQYLSGDRNLDYVLDSVKQYETRISWPPAAKALQLIKRRVSAIEQLIEMQVHPGIESGDTQPSAAGERTEQATDNSMSQLLEDLSGEEFYTQAERLPARNSHSRSSAITSPVPVLASGTVLDGFYNFAYMTLNDLFEPSLSVDISVIERESKIVEEKYGAYSPLVVCLRQLMVLALLKAGHTSRAAAEARLLMADDDNERHCIEYLRAVVEVFQDMSRRISCWNPFDIKDGYMDSGAPTLLVRLLDELIEMQSTGLSDKSGCLIDRLLPIVSIYRQIWSSRHDSTVAIAVDRIGSSCDDLIKANYRDHEAIFRLRFTQAFLLESLGRLDHAHRVLTYVYGRATKLNLSSSLKAWARVCIVRVLLALGRPEEASTFVKDGTSTEVQPVIVLYTKSLVLQKLGKSNEARRYKELFFNANPTSIDYMVLRLDATGHNSGPITHGPSSKASTRESI